MAHVEDRWTSPTGKVDTRGRPLREPNERWHIGKRWLATWTEAGQRRARSFDTKDAANAHLGAIAKAQRDGVHVAAHRMTFGEYGDQWLKAQIHQRPSTQQQVETKWRRQIRPALGRLLLTEITRQHIQSAVLRWSADGLAPATIAITYAYTSAIFKAAAADRLLVASPCAGQINLPKITHDKVVPLTTDQVFVIADRVHRRYRVLILLGAATGMRSGELRGLTLDRLRRGDVLAVRVDRQLTTTQPTWGPVKTKRSDRTITVDDITAGMLDYHMAMFPPHDNGLIFTGREKGPLARTSVASAWGQATEGMDLPDRSGLHALRHYHASLLIAAGVSVTAVADRLGHQDSTETLQTYAHLWPNDEERSRSAISAGLWA